MTLKKYAVFSGRSSRAEYWYFILFNLCISLIITYIDKKIGTVQPSGFGSLFELYFLAVLIPSIAVCIRRLHDVGKSGWWLLISFIPLIDIWYIILTIKDSYPGENKYGPNPKGM